MRRFCRPTTASETFVIGKCVLLVVLLMLTAAPGHFAQGAESDNAFGNLWPLWAEANPDSQQRLDHQPWQQFLDRYVTTGRDGINRVDYLKVAEADKQRLQRYLDYLASQRPTQFNKAEQLAYWINLYNAQTVRVVLDYPDKKSIRSMRPNFFRIGPWDKTYLTIDKQPVSLNDIEHRILRPIWRDHRLHFVLNCASIGCPNLSRNAFTDNNVLPQMALAETNYLSHPRGLSVTASGTLRLSSLFDWYRDDFAADRSALIDYLAARRPDVARQITAPDIDIEYSYDWNLNAP